MSVDHLQVNVIDCVYNNQTWLYESIGGGHNDVKDAIHDFYVALGNIVGLTNSGTLVSSTDTSGSDNMQWEAQDPVYGAASYLTNANATTLRNSAITQVATIENFQGYKDISIRSYRNDLQASAGYVYGTGADNEGLEVFISGCKFQTVEYVEPSNVDTLLLRVNDALDTISGLEFAGVVSSSTRASTDNLFIGVDDVTYNGNKYLTLIQASALRIAVLSAIASVSELDDTNIDVEIRIAKNDNQSSD